MSERVAVLRAALREADLRLQSAYEALQRAQKIYSDAGESRNRVSAAFERALSEEVDE